MTQAKFPNKLTQIPQDYYNQSTQPGSLVELKYDTYEAMSYKSHQQILHKRAMFISLMVTIKKKIIMLCI